MKFLRMIKNIIIVAIIIELFVAIGYFYINKKDDSDIKKDEVEIVDKIDTFGYVLDKSKSSYYQTTFEELKTVLKANEVNYEEYAKVISKLFVSDLYTLSNKISSSDIGGLNFVYKDFRKDFMSIAKTSLYNSVKSNLYGEREQELPTVTGVNIVEITNTTFKYGKNTFENAYLIKMTIDYEKDLGYPKNCEVVLINNENIVEIVKLK